MTDTGIFLFGCLVFLIVGGGFLTTLRELGKMGNRDQNDSYRQSRPIRQVDQMRR
jgi:hypothetical protein